MGSLKGSKDVVEVESVENVLVLEKPEEKLGNRGNPLTRQEGEREGKNRKEKIPQISISFAKHRHILTITFVTSWVAPLTGLGMLVCIVVFWTGAVTLSLGAQEKEKFIAGLAVCGQRPPACLAALVTLLTPTTGAFSIISEMKREHIYIHLFSVSERIGMCYKTAREPTASEGQTQHAD